MDILHLLIILNIFSMVKKFIVLFFLQKGVERMISYRPFYETLYQKNITEYALIFKHGIPANTLHRMKHGEAITTKTLDTLCEVLECSVSDILEYVSPEDI